MSEGVSGWRGLDRSVAGWGKFTFCQARLCLNSLWGKFAQKNNLDKHEYITNPCKWFDMLEDDGKIFVLSLHIKTSFFFSLQSRRISRAL